MEQVIQSHLLSPVSEAQILRNTVPLICIEHLKKSFNGNSVLNDFNLTVNKGENVVVMGKSGTGKSVLIQCIIGLLQPDAGVLTILGRNVAVLGKKELNKLRVRIGFLFQSAALYDSMTVRENIEFPLRRHEKLFDKINILRAVEEVLDSVGLLDAINKMPSELSGGMRKRVGLARTLILQPEIMLYDEPTTGLDPITSREISSLIRKVQQERKVTSVIISHDLACIEYTADRVVILKDGKNIIEGKYQALAQHSNPEIRAYFE